VSMIAGAGGLASVRTAQTIISGFPEAGAPAGNRRRDIAVAPGFMSPALSPSPLSRG